MLRGPSIAGSSLAAVRIEVREFLERMPLGTRRLAGCLCLRQCVADLIRVLPNDDQSYHGQVIGNSQNAPYLLRALAGYRMCDETKLGRFQDQLRGRHARVEEEVVSAHDLTVEVGAARDRDDHRRGPGPCVPVR